VSNIMFLRVLPFIGVLVAIILAVVFTKLVNKKNRGNKRMQEISDAIYVGSRAYLNQQAKVMIIFFIVIEILLYVMVRFDFLEYPSLLAFATGGGFSLIIGYIGMWISTKTNSRVTQAAKEKGLGEAMNIAFTAASAGGLLLGIVALFDTSFWFNILFWWYQRYSMDLVTSLDYVVNVLVTFTIGASFAAFFMRTGGGIFTKAADMGADYVGKVESGLREDDYRNPATIADNVGDNVGDVGGMLADSLESWVGAIISAEFLGFVAFKTSPFILKSILLPMIISTAGVFASIVAIFIIKGIVSRYKQNVNVNTLTTTTLSGIFVTSILIVIFSYIIVRFVMGIEYMYIFYASIGGIFAGFMIGVCTLIYTDAKYRPTRQIAESAKSGPATLVVNGLSYGMESILLPALIVIVSLIFSFYISGGSSNIPMGLYGVAISAVAMLSVSPFAIAIDVYGPIADNAGGIAEMAELGPEVRKTTDKLDAVGNTTAAIGKGILIGSAAITAISLGQAYFSKIGIITEKMGLSVIIDFMKDPKILAGLFLGVIIPFLFTSLLIGSVGKAANKVVIEARSQIKDVMSGKSKGDPKAFITIVTRAAQRGIIIPGILIFAIPVIVGLLLGPGGAVAMITGALLSGFALAIFMANSQEKDRRGRW